MPKDIPTHTGTVCGRGHRLSVRKAPADGVRRAGKEVNLIRKISSPTFPIHSWKLKEDAKGRVRALKSGARKIDKPD